MTVLKNQEQIQCYIQLLNVFSIFRTVIILCNIRIHFNSLVNANNHTAICIKMPIHPVVPSSGRKTVKILTIFTIHYSMVAEMNYYKNSLL